MDLDDDMPDSSPPKQASKRRPNDSASDLDFPDADDTDGDDDSDLELLEAGELRSRRPSKFGTPTKGTAKKRVLKTPKRLNSSKQKLPPSITNSHGGKQRPAGAGKQQVLTQQPVIVKSAKTNKAVTDRRTESSVRKITITTPGIATKDMSKIQKASSKAPLRKNKEIAGVHQPGDSVSLIAKNNNSASSQAKLKPALSKPRRNVELGSSPADNALEPQTDHSRSKAKSAKVPGVDMPMVEAQVEHENHVLVRGTSQQSDNLPLSSAIAIAINNHLPISANEPSLQTITHSQTSNDPVTKQVNASPRLSDSALLD